MRIERIKVNNLSGLKDVDLKFPAGPALFFSQDKNCCRMISRLIVEIFFRSKTQSFLNDQNSKGSVEIWLTGKSTGFHVSRFYRKGTDPDQTSNLVISNKTGQEVLIPEKMAPGEYIFLAGFNAFRLGSIVKWPKKGRKNFLFRIQNIRQGGDERFSLTKVRASLVGARKRLEEQKQKIMPVRVEYDDLRSEWEAAHRRQEEDRRLIIEIKDLQEKKKLIDEKIIITQKIQQRLALLSQNPDYRELRRLQGEMNRLEERCRELAANITELTHESQIDWAVIESLREECLEWAFLQKKVEGLAARVRQREQEINDVQNYLQISGYKELPENGDQFLRRTEEERLIAQKKLAELSITKSKIEKIQKEYKEEVIHLQDFELLTGVTVGDKITVRQGERHLALWKHSKIGSFVDKVLQERFGWKSISERLSYRLSQFYQNHHVSNYQEFSLKFNQLQKQHKIVERLQIELELLQEKVSREDELNSIADSRNQILKQAFKEVQAADFSAWLNGWEDYRQKKYLLAVWLDELKLDLEQQQIEENNLTVCAEKLREKLGKWETTATNRGEILAAVMRVAVQLRAKDEVEREAELSSQRFYNMLGDRDMEYLSGNLEPLADLEREKHFSDEERLANLTAWHNEQSENRRLQEEAERRLRYNRQFPELSVLEKKLETVKERITAYEDLLRAVDDAQSLLKISWQEWQARYGKPLNEETERLTRRFFSLSQHEKVQPRKMERHQSHPERTYLACRMASAQLALGNNTEVPLFFSVEEMDEEQGFWEEVMGYLSNLSFSRQVIFETSDEKLSQMAAAAGWQILIV